MEIKQNHLFIIGLLEFFGLLFAVISVLNIPYLYTLIFGKSIIVLMMFSNYIFLNRRYYINHYLGAFIILTGIFISTIPIFFNKSDNSEYVNIGYLLLYILSLGIHVINYTFREMFIKKDINLNVYMMNFYINLWQLLIGIICFPIIMLPIKGFGINPNDFSLYLNNAASCQFLQKNSIGDDSNCNYSLLWMFSNEILYISITYLIFEIIKKGSSVLYSIQNILIVPTTALIAYFCFKYEIIHATKAQKFSFYKEDYISIFLIMLGLAIYLQKPEYTLEIIMDEDYTLMNDLYPETPESISKIPFENPLFVKPNLSNEKFRIFSRHSVNDIYNLEESKSEVDERINILFDETEYKI
jgi:drug/metabolite transporter (DMT)-like permease